MRVGPQLRRRDMYDKRRRRASSEKVPRRHDPRQRQAVSFSYARAIWANFPRPPTYSDLACRSTPGTSSGPKRMTVLSQAAAAFGPARRTNLTLKRAYQDSPYESSACRYLPQAQVATITNWRYRTAGSRPTAAGLESELRVPKKSAGQVIGTARATLSWGARDEGETAFHTTGEWLPEPHESGFGPDICV
jgi:hypothetical protein